MGSLRAALILNPVTFVPGGGISFHNARWVHALWHVIILFRQVAKGFRSADLRHHVAALSGRDPNTISQGAMTYQLRRLRLHGLIERLPNSFRYRVTDFGFRAALFFTRLYNPLRPGLAAALPTLRRRRPTQAGIRYCQCPDQCVDQTSPTRRLKLDTFSPTVPTQAGLERRDAAAVKKAAVHSIAKLAPYRSIIDEYVFKFSDAALRFPGSGSYGTQR